MIGDPSGKNSERAALGAEKVARNSSFISENIERIFRNHEEHLWRGKGYKDTLQPLK